VLQRDLSVCHTSELCKKAETIKLPFAFRTRVGPMNHVLHGVHANMRRNNFEGETGKPYRDTLQSSVQTRLNRSRCRFGCGLAWAQSIMCYMGGPDPRGKGHFWWIGAPVVKYRHVVPQAVQKRLNRSICRFGCGLQWAERCTSSIVFARLRQCALMGGHVAGNCRIILNHPSTATMRLMAK